MRGSRECLEKGRRLSDQRSESPWARATNQSPNYDPGPPRYRGTFAEISWASNEHECESLNRRFAINLTIYVCIFNFQVLYIGRKSLGCIVGQERHPSTSMAMGGGGVSSDTYVPLNPLRATGFSQYHRWSVLGYNVNLFYDTQMQLLCASVSCFECPY